MTTTFSNVLRPQPGPQMQFMASPADITIYGGSAGSGKSWGLLAEPCRSLHVPDFGAVIFRRTYAQVVNKGGLWDASRRMYPILNGYARESDFLWRFPAGSDIRFNHLQYDSDVYNYQGSEIPLIEFDELTHFTEHQFWYMLSRNRSMLGAPGYVRAGTNPDADSWVAKLIDWWIDPDTGFPLQERSGVLRYFVRSNDELVWSSSREELEHAYPSPRDGFSRVKSLTFISATIYDNQELLKRDPGYLANLQALGYVEMARLLEGNWKVRPTQGKVFRRDDFQVIDAEDVPKGGITVRFFDFAATEKQLEKDDPDYTAGVLLRLVHGKVFILDVIAVQEGPAQVDELFYATVKADRIRCRQEGSRYYIRWEQEPGSAGKRESHRMTKSLHGFDTGGVPSTGSKLVRARALASQVKAHNVYVVQAKWTESFLHHMHGQPDLPHDDIMDGSSGAYNSAVVLVESDDTETQERTHSMSMFS